MLPLQSPKGFPELNDSQVIYGLLNEAVTFEEREEPSLSPLSHIVGHINVFFKDFWTIDFLNEKEGEN